MNISDGMWHFIRMDVTRTDCAVSVDGGDSVSKPQTWNTENKKVSKIILGGEKERTFLTTNHMFYYMMLEIGLRSAQIVKDETDYVYSYYQNFRLHIHTCTIATSR